jgi:hypothetical protein
MLVGLTTVLVAACQTAPRTGGRYNPDLITAEELETVTVNNAYEAVQRLRPRWFQAQRRSPSSMHTGTRVVAFLNKTNLGGFDMLRQISIDEVVYLEFLGNAEAVARLPGLGSGHVGAAIVVHTYDERQ